MKPRLLDLFCKQGGCSMGYHRAGFEVVGVDKDPQPNYSFEFNQADALEYLATHGHLFDIIHASPPCQGYSRSTAQFRQDGKEYADLMAPTRLLLDQIGKPYIIENVPSSPMRADLKLCGPMFNLKVVRWRWFELSGVFCMNPGKPTIRRGIVKSGNAVSVFGKGAYRKSSSDAHPVFDQGSVKSTWAYAMGIDWMDCEGMREAIPPAYTEWIGKQILNQVKIKASESLIEY